MRTNLGRSQTTSRHGRPIEEKNTGSTEKNQVIEQATIGWFVKNLSGFHFLFITSF